MKAPQITSAIPQRRYQYGSYQAVVLGDIESTDAARYRYILALIREGEHAPELFVACEKNPKSRAVEGGFRLHVISPAIDDDMGSSDRFGEIDEFCDEAFKLVSDLLGLAGVEAYRLM